MRAAPAGLLIKALLVSLYTLPANEMRPTVRPNEFDRVIGDPIATLATFYGLVFSHLSFSAYLSFKTLSSISPKFPKRHDKTTPH